MSYESRCVEASAAQLQTAARRDSAVYQRWYLKLVRTIVEPVVPKGEEHRRRHDGNRIVVLERADEREGHRVHKPEDEPSA